jgi:hypothetical protein
MSATMKFDVPSALEIRWEATDEDTIKHGVSFIAFEEQRPPEEQLKDLSLAFFQGLVKEAQDAAVEASRGEAERARAAEAVRQAAEERRPLIDKLLLHLKSRHANNLAELEIYSLKTTAGSRGVSVQKPRDAIQRRAFCLAYVEQQTLLPPAQQISDPPLSQIALIAKALQDNQAERTEQIIRRQRNVATRTAAAQRLHEALQAAAAVLIITCFDGQITRDLQQWGYDVVAKTAPTPGPSAEEEPANS